VNTVRRAILLLICCSLAAAGKTAADLKTVLDRAQNYVAIYEQQLGAIVAEEDYQQKAIWELRGQRTASRVERQHLSSDFLLVRVDNTWFGVRNVKQVNSTPLDAAPTNFSGILSQPPASAIQHFREIQASNTRYNIGDFVRTFNVPTFPLEIMQRANFRRFAFKKSGEKKFDGTLTWEIQFSETAHPTMIRDLQGKDQVQYGRLWIDPETGRIFSTETILEVKTGSVRFKAEFVVTYKQSLKLNMLVPDTMHEAYDSDIHHVQGIATYSNFRRFETDVKLNLAPQ
jgi:hypothetical protein